MAQCKHMLRAKAVEDKTRIQYNTCDKLECIHNTFIRKERKCEGAYVCTRPDTHMYSADLCTHPERN